MKDLLTTAVVDEAYEVFISPISIKTSTTLSGALDIISESAVLDHRLGLNGEDGYENPFAASDEVCSSARELFAAPIRKSNAILLVLGLE